MNIEINDFINDTSHSTIVDLLVDFNRKKTNNIHLEYSNKPLEIILRTLENEIIGGIYGKSIWNTMEIKTFIIKEEYRNKGFGNRLMEEVENEARKRKCDYISLDTFSFQAPEFYKKLGFQQVGVETDFPKSYNKYYFRKQICYPIDPQLAPTDKV
ncbi:GNAT family N-acetyltransferase [Flavobacterium sp.]|uniref:GNAT family N-acetyltransferase n=1 Tax=Flavobacterium sp. TaxID=239 RepID=UPI003C4E1DE0